MVRPATGTSLATPGPPVTQVSQCCHRVVRYPPVFIDTDQTDSRRPRQNTPNNTLLLLIDINAFLRKTGQQLVEIV